MNIEMLPGLTNVIRFPMEERVAPSMRLVFEIEPDVREVMNVAEAFQLEGFDPTLFDTSDCNTATYIAEQVLPLWPAEAGRALDGLLGPVAARAVQACREQQAMAKKAVEAQEKALTARTEGGYWLAPLEERAEHFTQRSAELLLEAHARCQEARGVNRAVGFARRGEPWAPYDVEAETERLVLAPQRASRPAA